MENKNLLAALVKAQLSIQPPVKEATGAFRNKYATLDAIYSACRKPLAENGLVLTHSVELDEKDRYFLVTHLYHVSGETMENRFPMIIEKNGNQGIASARTYACRYATCNLLALPGDADDDGEGSKAAPPAKKYYEKREAPKVNSPMPMAPNDIYDEESGEVLSEPYGPCISADIVKYAEQMIADYIAPHDAGYKERALKAFDVDCFEKIPVSKQEKMIQNINKKVAQIKAESRAKEMDKQAS